MAEEVELDLLVSLLDVGGKQHVLQLFNRVYGQNKQYFKLVAGAGGPLLFVDNHCSLVKRGKENGIVISVPFMVCRDEDCKCGAFHVCTHWPSKISTCKTCRQNISKNLDNAVIYKKYPLLQKLSPILLKRLLKYTKFIIRPETPILFEKCTPDQLRFPQVCEYYNSDTGCLGPCLFFHLCKKFASGHCKNFDASCSHSHDMNSKHNRKIVDTCGGLRMDSKALLQVINSQTSVTAIAMNMLQNDTKIHNHDCEICVWNLVGKCGKSGSCPFHHINLPFWWQYMTEDATWDNWDRDSVLILEKAYCNPIIRTVEIKINGSIAIIDFPTMTMMDGDFRIRRMSTGPVHGGRHLGSLATAYHWHWEEMDNVWHEFPSCVTQGKHTPQLELPSHVIETAYLNGSEKQHFKISDSDFVLLFGGMQMKEDNCRNIRKICRRPIHRSVPRCAGIVTGKEDPEHEYYTCVREATKDEQEFVMSCLKSDETPTKIQSLSSNLLDKQFSKRLKENSTLHLFHPGVGTDLTAVAQHGLLLNDTPPLMKKYGTGLHLARDESYALHFSESRDIVLCEVVVANYCRGKPGDTKPPVSEDGSPYQCCVNNVADPEVFVLYDVMCVRPKFWVTF